jgi:hypothetical protein
MKKKSYKNMDNEFKTPKKPKLDKFDPARKNKKYHEKIIYNDYNSNEKTLDF